MVDQAQVPGGLELAAVAAPEVDGRAPAPEAAVLQADSPRRRAAKGSAPGSASASSYSKRPRSQYSWAARRRGRASRRRCGQPLPGTQSRASKSIGWSGAQRPPHCVVVPPRRRWRTSSSGSWSASGLEHATARGPGSGVRPAAAGLEQQDLHPARASSSAAVSRRRRADHADVAAERLARLEPAPVEDHARGDAAGRCHVRPHVLRAAHPGEHARPTPGARARMRRRSLGPAVLRAPSRPESPNGPAARIPTPRSAGEGPGRAPAGRGGRR